MEAQSEEQDILKGEGDGIPVCLKCFQPVNPLYNYCPNCGGAIGNFTHYLPFVNIRWQASVWGQAWRQVWFPDVSILGRLFRFIMIVWMVPIMLIGLLFRSSQEVAESQCQHGPAADPGEAPGPQS